MSSLTSHLSSKDTHATAAAECLSVILTKELTTYSCKGYLDPSDPTMITDADRKILVDWCYGVVDNCDFSRETVAVAMEMVDRFLSVTAGPAALWETISDVARIGNEVLHSKGNFQLVTIAALYNAIKAKEKVVISGDQYSKMCGGVYTNKEIEVVESTLLRGLSWRHNTPSTAYQVGHCILSLMIPYVNLPEATWAFLLDEIKYQTEHAVRDYFFSTLRTSTIALAAIFNAVESLSSKEKRHEVLGVFLERIVDCFDFDNSDVISKARKRLKSLLKGDSVVEDLDSKSINLDNETVIDWDDFMNTLESDYESRPSSPQLSSCSFDDEVTDDSMNALKSDDETTKSDPKPMTMPSYPVAAVSPESIPMKPKRPPTAYHIYLQIEKEFIVQSIAGEDADASVHDDKVYLDYVPERYRQTKLSPDWYFRPGKRKRRKHRAQHGKIGFIELTKTIASRWAKLDETNPEIKSFVQKLADQELEDYRRDLEEYKKLVKKKPFASTNSFNESKKRALEADPDGALFSSSQKMIRLVSRERSSRPLLSKSLQLFDYFPASKEEGKSISSSSEVDEFDLSPSQSRRFMFRE